MLEKSVWTLHTKEKTSMELYYLSINTELTYTL